MCWMVCLFSRPQECSASLGSGKLQHGETHLHTADNGSKDHSVFVNQQGPMI